MGFSGYNEAIFAQLKISAFITPDLLELFSNDNDDAFESNENAEPTVIINSKRPALDDVPICLDSLAISLEGEKDTFFEVGLLTVPYIPASVL